MSETDETFTEQGFIWLAAEDQLRFAQVLLNPAPLTPGMERARAAHARLMQE